MPLCNQACYVVIEADAYLLARFVAAVAQLVARDMVTCEVGGVDETHAAAVEEKHESVAGEVERGMRREIDLLDALYVGESDGAFGCFLDARVGFLERRAVNGEPRLHGTVVHRPHVAHVERHRV